MLEDQTDHSLKGEALVKERKTKLDAILAEHGTVSMVSDLKKHIATYQNRIKLSDGVVVLAHSQGSLFANMAMHGIEYAQRPSIAQVFIGPAAGLIYDHAREDFVSDTGRWTRFENDRIIWAAEVWHRDQADVKCIFTGRVVVCNGRDITIAPLTATVGHSNSLFSDNHKLVESYLAVDASRERIMTHLVEAVKIVRKKPAPAPALDNLIVDINWTATTGSPQMHLNVLEPADVAGNPDVQVYDKFINGRGTMVEAGQNGKQRYELKCKDTPDGTSNFKIGFHTGYFTVPNSKIAFNIAIAVDGGDGKSSEATNADTGSISKVRSLYEVAVTRKDGKCTFTVTQPTVTHWNL